MCHSFPARTIVPVHHGTYSRDSHKHKHTIMHPAVGVHKVTSCRTLLNKKLVKCNRHLISVTRQHIDSWYHLIPICTYVHMTHTIYGLCHSPALWPSGPSASRPLSSCTACIGGGGGVQVEGWCVEGSTVCARACTTDRGLLCHWARDGTHPRGRPLTATHHLRTYRARTHQKHFISTCA